MTYFAPKDDLEIIRCRAELAHSASLLTRAAIDLAKTLPISAEQVQSTFDLYAEHFGEQRIADVLRGLSAGVDGFAVLREMRALVELRDWHRSAEFRRAGALAFHAGAVRDNEPSVERLSWLLRPTEGT